MIKILEENIKPDKSDADNAGQIVSGKPDELRTDEVVEMKENDIVIASSNIGNIPKGTTGTVVHKYANTEAYEVEFIIEGSSFVETILKSQIIKK